MTQTDVRWIGREGEIVGVLTVEPGFTNREIAAQIGLSEKTVKAYLASAYHRTGARNRTELVVWAVRGQLPEYGFTKRL